MTSQSITDVAFENILVEVVGSGDRKTGLIRLNRPKQLNALSDPLMDELGRALLAFDADDGIGCIVLTGSERAFAAGADIPTMAPHTFMSAFKSGLISKNWRPSCRCASRSSAQWQALRWAAAVSWR